MYDSGPWYEVSSWRVIFVMVMGKYGTGITENENSNIAAFVATRLESSETFGE